jgi:hypothetical protein
MFDQPQLLARLAELFERLSIPYAVCGSYASNQLGIPRTTVDIDFVVDFTPPLLRAFIEQLGPDFYLSEEAAEEALRQRGMFNVIHIDSSLKADLMIRKDDAFNIGELRRATRREIAGVSVMSCTAEDLIISKLQWHAQSPSERQWRDAAAVASVQWKSLDMDYLRHWAARLSIAEDMDRLLKDAASFQKPK